VNERLLSTRLGSLLARFAANDAVEVEFDFAVDAAPEAFDEAGEYVVALALTLDRFQRSARRDGEGALANDLVAGVEFRDEEVGLAARARKPIARRSPVTP